MNHATERLFELDTVSQSLADAIPSRIKEAIDNYVWTGRPTGDFVQAVLENRLMEAIGRADKGSLRAIKDICRYVYNAVPSGCHGSPEAIEAHLAKGRAVQQDFEDSILNELHDLLDRIQEDGTIHDLDTVDREGLSTLGLTLHDLMIQAAAKATGESNG